MYQVYSVLRPGHPRLAWLACGGLLLITVLMAVGLTRYKATALLPVMDPQPTTLPEGRVRLRLPEGWEPIGPEIQQLPGVVAVYHPADGSGGLLVVLRGAPEPHGVPSVQGLEALESFARIMEPGARIEGEPGRLGPFFAWCARLESPGQRYTWENTRFLGRAAIAPDGQVVGLMLGVPRNPHAADRTLLEDLAEHLALTDLTVVSDPAQIMDRTGIRFPPPAGARFIAADLDAELPWPRVRLMGGEGLQRWYLEVSAVPILPPRSPADLAGDCARSLLQTAGLDEPPRVITPGGRQGARIDPPMFAEAGPGMQIRCVALDDEWGLLLVGRHDREGADPLAQVADAVAGQAVLSGSARELPVLDARGRARALLNELADEGLSARWPDRRDGAKERYKVEGPALELAQELRSFQPGQDGAGHRAWELEVRYPAAVRVAGEDPILHQQWLIRDDGRAHEGWYRKRSKARADLDYHEERQDPADTVRCRLTIGADRQASWDVEVDATYACEPMVLELASRLAAQPRRGPALFVTTDPWVRQKAYWLAAPLGAGKVPGSGGGRSASIVCLQQDYDPSPVLLYFSDEGRLITISYDNVVWQTRIERKGSQRQVQSR